MTADGAGASGAGAGASGAAEPARAFGAQSMTTALQVALVAAPGESFGRAFDDPVLGFREPVDLEAARREHETLVGTLAALGVDVRLVEDEPATADGIYVFDPLLVTDRGAIPLRSGKPNRVGEETTLEHWTAAHGIPTVGRIEPPGTVDGGDTLWLRPDLLCVGRSLRTNDAGARQLASIVGGDVRVFDLPYWRGPAELVHLLSVVSPVADDLAVVYPPLLPVGLWQLLGELGIRMIEAPDEEYDTLGCNVLAVRPGVLVVADGNPVSRRRLEAAGCKVHAIPLRQIGWNGSGGPTCLVRPILRA